MEPKLVTLLCLDQKTADGGSVYRQFELAHAQAILDVKHPQATWKLEDAGYERIKGVITAKPAPADQ